MTIASKQHTTATHPSPLLVLLIPPFPSKSICVTPDRPPLPSKQPVILSAAEGPAVAFAFVCFRHKTKPIPVLPSKAEGCTVVFAVARFHSQTKQISVILSEAEGPAVALAFACFHFQNKQILVILSAAEGPAVVLAVAFEVALAVAFLVVIPSINRKAVSRAKDGVRLRVADRAGR